MSNDLGDSGNPKCSQLVLTDVINRANKLDIRVCDLQNELKACKINFENELKQAKVSNEQKLKKLQEKEALDQIALETTLIESEKLKKEVLTLKSNKNELELRLKHSEAQSTKTRDQFDGMNAKFEEWRSKYHELNTRLIEMDKIEAKIKSNIAALMEENEKLRILNRNSDNIIQLLSSEQQQFRKKYEQKYADKCMDLEKSSEANRVLENKNNALTQRLIQCGKDFQETKVRIESMHQEKEDLAKKLLKSHQTNATNVQTISELKSANKILEAALRDRVDKIDALERERADMVTQYQNAKINDELQMNELRLKIKKLDMDLKNEIDEKANLKAKYEESKQQLKLTESTLSELRENMKEVRAKKLFDNFTQTVPNWTHVDVSNKYTQTLNDEAAATTNTVWTQTSSKVLRSYSTQTDMVLAVPVVYTVEQQQQQQQQQTPIPKMTSVVVPLAKQKKIIFTEETQIRDEEDDQQRHNQEEGEEQPSIIPDSNESGATNCANSLPTTAKANENNATAAAAFRNRNLFYQNSSRDDLNRLFKVSSTTTTKTTMTTTNKENRNQYQNQTKSQQPPQSKSKEKEEQIMRSSSSTTNKTFVLHDSVKRKSVKRVRFSET